MAREKKFVDEAIHLWKLRGEAHALTQEGKWEINNLKTKLRMDHLRSERAKKKMNPRERERLNVMEVFQGFDHDGYLYSGVRLTLSLMMHCL